LFHDKYNVRGVPTLVLIDKDGYIRYRHVGLTEESIISAEIREIPEFPAAMIPLVFIILALIVAVSGKVIRRTKQN